MVALTEPLRVFTIFDRPSDFPNSVVIRAFADGKPTGWYILLPDLAHARSWCEI